jgi:ubiquinol-cytochrome c reductase cytochrome b subunit
VVLLAALGWTGLTVAAVKTTPKPTGTAQIDFSAPTDWMQLSPAELAGIAYFRQENCVACHALDGKGGKVGPDLTQASIHKDAAWMIQHFKRPSSMMPGTSMPPIQLSDEQLSALAAFLLKLNPNNATALQDAPDFAVKGALVYQSNKCGTCHMVNNVGVKLGPPLNGLAKRESRSWVEDHFADPQKMSPGSFMPPYKFNAKDLDNITSYLMSLPDI